MEGKNIIMILVAIIVILVVAIGFTLLNPLNAKEPCKIKITSDEEQDEGGELSIKLTDINKNPISKQIVNITVTNKEGEVVVNDVVKTNPKGNAKLDLDLKKGKYTVNVDYCGNENYTGNNTTHELTIKEKVAQATVTEQLYYNSPDSDYYKSETDGAYHKKQEGVKYVYAKDGRTGEWCYWLDKS